MDTTSRNVPGNAQASRTNGPTVQPADGQNLSWRFEGTSIKKKDDDEAMQGMRAKSLWVIIYSVVTAGESESFHFISFHDPSLMSTMSFIVIASQTATEKNTRPSRPTMRPLWMNVFFMNECHLWMNKWFIEWIDRCMLLPLDQDHFSVEKIHDFDVFNECVTRPTNQRTEPIIEMRGHI